MELRIEEFFRSYLVLWWAITFLLFGLVSYCYIKATRFIKKHEHSLATLDFSNSRDLILISTSLYLPFSVVGILTIYCSMFWTFYAIWLVGSIAGIIYFLKGRWWWKHDPSYYRNKV